MKRIAAILFDVAATSAHAHDTFWDPSLNANHVAGFVSQPGSKPTAQAYTEHNTVRGFYSCGFRFGSDYMIFRQTFATDSAVHWYVDVRRQFTHKASARPRYIASEIDRHLVGALISTDTSLNTLFSS